MFALHQKQIADYGLASPDNMARVLTFVLLTIRQPLFNVAADMKTLETGTPEEIMGVLFGSKHRAYVEIWETREARYHQALEIDYHDEGETRADNLLCLFHAIHGLGFVKSGFSSQLLFGCSGCLDSHNVRAHGLNPNTIRAKTWRRLATKQRKAREYNALIGALGGTEALWDNWCHMVADSATRWKTGFEVSAAHSAICLQ